MNDDRDRQFEELLKYYPAVVAFLKQLGFDKALDLTQDVFTRVYEHMGDYRGQSKLSYLLQIARRLAYNTVRDGKTKKRDGGIREPEEKLLVLEDKQTPKPDQAYESRENADRLYRAVGRLPNDLRICIMYTLAEHSQDEIASILGISVPALKSRLATARARLKEILGEDPRGLGGDQ